MDDIWTRIYTGQVGLTDKDFQELRVRFVLLAKRRIGEREAEDVAQQACLTVFEKCRELPPGVNFPAWALQVLRNKIGNHMKQRARNNEISTDEHLLSAAPAHSDLEARLTACLHRISLINRRYARVLNLVHAGYSAEEIGERMDISKNTLYVLLHRSRCQLRKCLEEGGGTV